MLEDLYSRFYLIRRVEEEIARVYPSDRIKSPIHLSVGQEAVSVGVCATLRKQDVVFGSYRSHALYLAKGGDLNKMIAELYGKKTGCAKGRGGSMHLIDREAGVMGTSAIVATQIPQAAGFAYAQKIKRTGVLTAVFFGDGAAEEGAFFETLNFAALHRLPLLLVCENNEYAVFTPRKKRQAGSPIFKKAESFGIASRQVDGRNVLNVLKAAQEAVSAIQENQGPYFLECSVDRIYDHVGPGICAETSAGFQGRDLSELAAKISLEAVRKIEAAAEEKIREAFEFAENSPFPEAEELYLS